MGLTNYAGAPELATLSGDISDSSTSVGVSTTTGWPDSGTGTTFVCIINANAANQEKIQVSTYSALTLTITERGYDGTSAYAHDAGEPIIPCWDAVSAADDNDHVYNTTRNDHKQYLQATSGGTGAHDTTARHFFGSSGALGSPGAATNILTGTTSSGGTGALAAREDHVHAGLPGVSGVTDGYALTVLAAGDNGMQWSESNTLAINGTTDEIYAIVAGCTGSVGGVGTASDASHQHASPGQAIVPATRQVATLSQQSSVTTYTTPGLTCPVSGTWLVSFHCNFEVSAGDSAAPYATLKKNGTAIQLIAGPSGHGSADVFVDSYEDDLSASFPVVLENGDALTVEILSGGNQTYFIGGPGTRGSNWFIIDPLYN